MKITGIGVDLKYFEMTPIENYKTFLMISRLIPAKGVYDYCEAARIVKQKYPDAHFQLLGLPCSIKEKNLKKYTEAGIVEYLGVAEDVRPYIRACSVHVLPTYYREGLVMVNMEAAAMGRAVITTDNIGAKETVQDGHSGFLIKSKDIQAIAEKMIYFIANPVAVKQMGQNARAFAEKSFEHSIINEKICKIIGASDE